jgi:hypothetical protein
LSTASAAAGGELRRLGKGGIPPLHSGVSPPSDRARALKWARALRHERQAALLQQQQAGSFDLSLNSHQRDLGFNLAHIQWAKPVDPRRVS